MLKAIKEGDEEALKAMIKSGKNLAEPNKEGWLPLHEAAYYGQLSCLKTLQQGEAAGRSSEGQDRTQRAATPSFWSFVFFAPQILRGRGTRQDYITPSWEKEVTCPHPPCCHLSRPLGTGEPNS